MVKRRRGWGEKNKKEEVEEDRNKEKEELKKLGVVLRERVVVRKRMR